MVKSVCLPTILAFSTASRKGIGEADILTHLAQALVLAKLKARYNPIVEATNLVLFMGTPHRGSGHAELGDMVLSVLNTLFNNPSSSLLGSLTPNNELLMNLNDDVCEILADIQVVNYVEDLPMKGMKRCVSFAAHPSREVLTGQDLFLTLPNCSHL